MRRTIFLLTFCVLVAFGLSAMTRAQAQDGIPDNCENPRGEFYRQSIFPRYEPQNQRLVLVDWSTGADVLTLGNTLADTRILGWSVDCRYLATAIGSVESMDTVVWDTVNGGQIGRVPDAHQRPHTITWGPGNYLVVETRDGAILWNVGANTQVTLTDSFDPQSGRNFSRLRWNTTHNQLTVNLAVGGRVVYDLSTGQETVALPAENDLVQDVPENSVVIGGHPYACNVTYNNTIDAVNTRIGLALRYDYISDVIYLGSEAVVMLESDVDGTWFRSDGFSSSCRYVAAHLGRPHTTTYDVSDTIIWDVVEGRRVGTFADAHEIAHPLHWGIDDSVIIETRDGAYLWHLPTDTRTLLTSHVETSLNGYRWLRSFAEAVWDLEHHQLHAILLESPEIVSVFDSQTGALIETYPVGSRPLPRNREDHHSTSETAIQGTVIHTPMSGTNGMSYYRWIPSYRGNGTYLDCNGLIPDYNYAERDFYLRNSLTDGEPIIFDDDMNTMERVGWSPDCRYVLVEESFVDNSLPYDDAPVDDPYAYTGGENLVIWNVESRSRVAEIARPYRDNTYTFHWWSPDRERAVIRTTTGSYIVELATGQTTLLTFTNNDGAFYTYANVYWDYSRGQLLVSGWDYIYAFDMQTGVERLRLPGSNSATYFGGSRFSVGTDNTTLFAGTYVYNLDTLENAHFDVDLPNRQFYGNLVALSPDARYLVMARDMIRVWDLENLPEELNDRDPIYRYQGPDARIRRVRFVDNVTIETTSARGVQYWNIETGAEVTWDG